MSSLRIKSMSELRSVAGMVEDLTGVRPSEFLCGRWTEEGCRGVRLDATRIRGLWESTPEAFDAFVRVASFNAAVDLVTDPGEPMFVSRVFGWFVPQLPAFC